MNEEATFPPSRDEAHAALAEVNHVLATTRLAIAQGPTASILILWGVIWLIADVATQFDLQTVHWLWPMLDIVGMLATWWLTTRHRVHVRQPGMWRLGVFWVVLFLYAGLWLCLLLPGDLPFNSNLWGNGELAFRHITAFAHTVPMFAYIVIGLWFGRFLIWLGVLVTVLIVAGLWLVPGYYYLWLGLTGGGSLIVAGLFIKKFWK
ncbi:MAG TPA: hypothetical protein VK737_02410 [Opitutales bacterium]|jgi:hypothetical protein|nr:hypothetical protein [Opitutales bacterium]